MGFNYVIFWLIMFAIFVIAELVTSGALISIWFCLSSLVAMAAAKAGTGFIVQMVVFVVFSTALLILTKPFIRKVLKFNPEPTNADAIIGGVGVVVETINNIEEKGAVKIDGKIWTARALDDNIIIKEGSKVKALEIRGVKLYVELI